MSSMVIRLKQIKNLTRNWIKQFIKHQLFTSSVKSYRQMRWYRTHCYYAGSSGFIWNTCHTEQITFLNTYHAFTRIQSAQNKSSAKKLQPIWIFKLCNTPSKKCYLNWKRNLMYFSWIKNCKKVFVFLLSILAITKLKGDQLSSEMNLKQHFLWQQPLRNPW